MITAECTKHDDGTGNLLKIVYSYTYQSCPICDLIAKLESRIEDLQEEISELEELE
jgi:hypothetical protein